MVCMPSSEGSLKWYTDSPPVLDRFKKIFLHGIAGGLTNMFFRQALESNAKR